MADEEILCAYPYNVIHLHACGLHLTDRVVELRGLRAVEITLERETGRFDFPLIVSSARKMQRAGLRVVLNGELDDAELGETVDSLEPEGLAIFSWRPEPDYRPVG